MSEIRTPALCPECGGTEIRRIIYGLPSTPLKFKAVLGGCGVPPEKERLWHCRDCGHEFDDESDPAQVAFRKSQLEAWEFFQSEEWDNQMRERFRRAGMRLPESLREKN